jgi:hypothetical protein
MINQLTKNFFDKNGYVFIKNFLNKEVTTLLYNYSITQVKSIDYKKQYSENKFDSKWDGDFGDGQVYNSYYRYGDPIIDTLLTLSLNNMEIFTGKNLVPTYSYWRFYEKGDELVKHRDRESCEISTTICLGYNYSNIDINMNKNYSWPMFIKEKNNENLPVNMEPGDMLIYRGCEIEHWREKLLGLNHTQAFLHYNEKEGPYNIQYDGRPFVGIPKLFKE